jgi:voltage-gated potassium channel
MKPAQLLGVTGVEPHECAEARLWARRLEWPLLAVVLWIPVQWYLEETGTITLQHGKIGDWVIWLMFLFETVLLASLVRDKVRYLRGNWMNLLIIVGGVPLLWHYTPLAGLLRSLRLVLVLVILLRLSKTLRILLVRHRLGMTLAVSLGVVVLSGIVVTRLDPSVGTVWDGMWWAWVTVATVGYGDIVPHNGAGRLFGAFLILLGVVLVSLLTANLSAFLIGGEVERVEREERREDVLLQDIAERLERIEQRLDELQPDTMAKPSSSPDSTPD